MRICVNLWLGSKKGARFLLSALTGESSPLGFLPEDAAPVQPPEIKDADDDDYVEDPPPRPQEMKGSEIHRGICSHLIFSHLVTSFLLINHPLRILLFPKTEELFSERRFLPLFAIVVKGMIAGFDSRMFF